ncbi:MAG: hypothetical protein JRI74_09275 [Deltaproteobacteria bacterium]|nr:hypothetical protein [Deltaproteobacteria bacterium]
MDFCVQPCSTIMAGQAESFTSQNSFGQRTLPSWSSDPGTPGVEALYLMGIIYAHPQNPDSSLDRSLESFHILIKKHPKSDLTREAEAWVSTLRKIKKRDKEILELKDQIDKLKEIDLGIEEKKRRELPH